MSSLLCCCLESFSSARCFVNTVERWLKRIFHRADICRNWMCQMFSMIQWRWFGFVGRNRQPRIFLSRSNNFTMIGLKSTLQGTVSPSQLVIVEGNIGVGKSTLACQLARQLNYKVFLEPTTKNPYLAKFYRDPKRYALKLQLWIFRQRFRTYIEATQHVLKYGKQWILTL